MDKINPLFTATATAVGGRNGQTRERVLNGGHHPGQHQ
jgi:hypothetical protein